MSTLKVDTIRDNGSGFNDVVAFQNSGGTENARLCRAFVNFDGTGNVAIRGSFNVNSITDNAQGTYTVNLSNAMSDTNYVIIGHGSGGHPVNSSNYNRVFECSHSSSSQISCIAYAPNNSAIVDIVYCSVTVFR